MDKMLDRSGEVPGVVSVTRPGSVDPVRYETGKGCLMLSVVLLVLIGLAVAAIVLVGESAAVN
jgi:phage-related minor tail protein